MRALALAVVAAVALSGCASTGRLLSYGNNNAQAQIDVAGRGDVRPHEVAETSAPVRDDPFWCA